jgi:hypothetical protein
VRIVPPKTNESISFTNLFDMETGTRVVIQHHYRLTLSPARDP